MGTPNLNFSKIPSDHLELFLLVAPLFFNFYQQPMSYLLSQYKTHQSHVRGKKVTEFCLWVPQIWIFPKIQVVIWNPSFWLLPFFSTSINSQWATYCPSRILINLTLGVKKLQNILCRYLISQPSQSTNFSYATLTWGCSPFFQLLSTANELLIVPV